MVEFVQGLRQVELYKVPGIAETLDWAEALVTLDVQELDLPIIRDTLGVLLKYEEDVRRVRGATTAHYVDELAAAGI